MADVAQLVRALVCGTRCREFESHHPPHFKIRCLGLRHLFFILKSFLSKVRADVSVCELRRKPNEIMLSYKPNVPVFGKSCGQQSGPNLMWHSRAEC